MFILCYVYEVIIHCKFNSIHIYSYCICVPALACTFAHMYLCRTICRNFISLFRHYSVPKRESTTSIIFSVIVLHNIYIIVVLQTTNCKLRFHERRLFFKFPEMLTFFWHHSKFQRSASIRETNTFDLVLLLF